MCCISYSELPALCICVRKYICSCSCYCLTVRMLNVRQPLQEGKAGKILPLIVFTAFANSLGERTKCAQRSGKTKGLFPCPVTQGTSTIFWNETTRKSSGGHRVIINSQNSCIHHFHWNLCLIRSTGLIAMRERITFCIKQNYSN